MKNTKGNIEVHDFTAFKLHVYNTNDALGDASYIIEGRDALVTLEQPLFKDNIAEFDAYLDHLAKPVVHRVADYHVGGTHHHPVVMAEGMPTFVQGPVYSGMMQGFTRAFGDAITDMPTGPVTEVTFDSRHDWAGITFHFRRGAASDFPGASILIGGSVYYTHWTPAKAHVSPLQVSSPAAIDAEIAEAEQSLASGATLFIGGHGGAARRDAVEFKIAYLRQMKKHLTSSPTPEAFIRAMQQSYPNLPGEANLPPLAQALYPAR